VKINNLKKTQKMLLSIYLIFSLFAVILDVIAIKKIIFLMKYNKDYNQKFDSIIKLKEISPSIITLSILGIIVLFMFLILYYIALINYYIFPFIKDKKIISKIMFDYNKYREIKLLSTFFSFYLLFILANINFLILSIKFKFYNKAEIFWLIILVIAINAAFITIIYKLRKLFLYIKNLNNK